MYSFAFCLFIKERKKEQKNKHTEELHRPGIEPRTSQSPVLHFTTALMHTTKRVFLITTKSVFLNNSDYLNYNLY